MKSRKKFWSIIAVCCIVVGGIVSFTAAAASGFDFSEFNSTQYEEKVYTVTDSFENIELAADWENICLLPSPNKDCRVVCSENDNLEYTVKVEDNTLKIERHEHSQWYEHIGVFWFSSSPEMIIYLPEQEYETLSITTSSGDVTVPKEFTFSTVSAKTTSGNLGIAASVSRYLKLQASSGDIVAQKFVGDSVEIQTTSGGIAVEDCTAESIQLASTSGDITLTNTFAKQKMNLQDSSGNIALSTCDAPTIAIQTTSGDVGGSLLSGKDFSVQTSSGDVILPEDSSETETCSITTVSGNIIITIQ